MSEKETESLELREGCDQSSGLEAIRPHSSIEVFRALLERRRRSLGKGSMSAIPEVGPPGPRVDARTPLKISRRSGIQLR